MLGLWLEDLKLSLREDLAVPEPPAGEALVRVLRAGICNTDLELLRGYYPFSGVPGHEFVGEVVGGAPGLIGKRVVGEINASCGTCTACAAGRSSHCENRTVLGIVGRNGAFAEYLTLPIGNLHVVPDAVPTDVATFTEPLAAALEIQEQVRISSADRVLVAGIGKLGTLIAQILALTGCDLVAVNRRPEKRALLEGRGIEVIGPEDVAAGSFDVAVECTGNSAGFEMARRALRPRGTLVMKSTYAGKLAIDVSSLVVDEITLIGSRCGPFAPALELLAAGRVDVESLIEQRFPLADGLTAFERAAQPGVLKVLLDIA
ncbi:MAG: alcohol dehydrogenase catalytic domain-containing protein [bacterium]|nr:alcohol dehydrogenase catalytic domain-containing protein [bacterium]